MLSSLAARPLRPHLLLLLLLPLALAAAPSRRLPRHKQIYRSDDSPASPPRPSSANCTWLYLSQPLDHFATGTGGGGNTYDQRYCLFSGFAAAAKPAADAGAGAGRAPIFFYVGNESPVEEYVNSSGLMWQLAPSFGAHLVFAEHRYFGESVPRLRGVPDCLAYCTSAQALADYALLVRHLRDALKTSGPVIAFGGSYGGMLAAWARMKYPSTFAGAVAASAPVWGFPGTAPPLDGSFRAITHAATRDGGGVDNDRCPTHLLASWVLMRVLGSTESGRARLSKAFRLCEPLRTAADAEALIAYAQSPWFLMSEGDFPFPSTYITFAVGDNDFPMPAWPVRVACDHVGREDFGVRVTGNPSNVTFSVETGDGMVVSVDWGEATVSAAGGGGGGDSVDKMLSGLREAIGVWYNVSGALPCFFGTAGAEDDAGGVVETQSNTTAEKSGAKLAFEVAAATSSRVCTADTLPGGNAAGWDVLCCNENLNLVNSLVQGVGNDMFWPPSVASRAAAKNRTALIAGSSAPCADRYARRGLYGVPETADPFATWEDVYYGGKRGPGESSNIFFSNGALDPWSSAGVLSNVSASVEAYVLDRGAHHLDLFFADPEHDPPCAAEARRREAVAIQKWLHEWNARVLTH